MYKNVYLVSTGSFFPGDPVSNDQIDQFIQPINRHSDRLKRKILQENGIEQRYYGIDREGKTRWSLAQMAQRSIEDCLKKTGVSMADVGLLCTGTTGGDVAIPGFANMLQGELKAQPMEVSTHTGICMSGVVALRHAADAVELKRHRHALVSASEFPSRMFKKTRFVDTGYDVDFDSHFLRWMLSDAAGTWLISDSPAEDKMTFQILDIHIKSFSGDFPTCMQIGAPVDDPKTSYLDYSSIAEAEKNGAFLLRQNIRLLPHLFDIFVHEYLHLIQKGLFKADEIKYFLPHFSSQRFAPVVEELLTKSGAIIPKDRWYSNLKTRGNTGSASIFVMMDDFIKEKNVQPGDKILCAVPESGRLSMAFILLEVTAPKAVAKRMNIEQVQAPADESQVTDLKVQTALRGLAEVWHSYRSQIWRTPFFQRVEQGTVTKEDYIRWMQNWIPQVREGAKWMRTAVSNLDGEFAELKNIIEEHAGEEQNDWKILHQDYLNAGGTQKNPDLLKRNSGGEALNAFMFYKANQKNAVDLLGGIYIIEGTGQRIIPAFLPFLKQQLDLGPECYKFLQYHGQNDENHLYRWLSALTITMNINQDPEAIERLTETAKTVADLYLMQFKFI
jgi:3-oxoacyl-[acyl-carrier-protein] synthase-3